MEDITRDQHNELRKYYYEKNRFPDSFMKERIAFSHGIPLHVVDSWFSECRVMDPEELWAKISLKKKTLEEQKRKRELERGEEMAKKKKITYYQHKKLTKFYETNSLPDDDQMEIIGKSVAMTNVAVDCWFFRCRTVGTKAMWQEVGEVDLEEWRRKKEEMETELMTKLSQAEAKIASLTAENPKLESSITNLTTCTHAQQSDPVRFLTIEKELARVSSQLKAFEEAELKKENERMKDQKEQLEATLQSKKKLEEQVENEKKENEELRKIIAQQAAEITESKNLIADKNAEIQNLTAIKNCVKGDQAEDKITFLTAENQKLESWITNITTMSHVQSDPVKLLKIEKQLARVSSLIEEAELKKENERLKEQKKELEAMLQSKKKLEEQVENKTKENEELSLLLKEKNNKIETMTQRNEEQSAELREQVENGKKENEEMNKIIAQQWLELKVAKTLVADKAAEIQNLTSIQNSVKDAVNAQQEQITKLLTKTVF
ncbi:hypothetical protein CRE_01324 [Caenorhabditis remanei]|uniref:Homeobox domain-containing protein n=1 Tax=Caenorhabditis remanei TaxID=31234 RepID=E3N9P2_CAERE|nr:hypothetical protein CRE_01324 [Caenorhabditis remanei]